MWLQGLSWFLNEVEARKTFKKLIISEWNCIQLIRSHNSLHVIITNWNFSLWKKILFSFEILNESKWIKLFLVLLNWIGINDIFDSIKWSKKQKSEARNFFSKFIYQKILFGPSIPIELMHCNCNAHCNAMPFIICMDQWILLKEDQKNQEWKIEIKNMKVSTQPYRCECESDFQLISLEIYSSMNQTHWCQAQMKLKRIMSHLIAEIIIIIILNDIKANVKRIEFGILK